MRELKFRAWDKRLNVMVYDDNESYDFEISLNGSFCVMINESMVCRRSEDFELMQFIGLHDKNGKEIYNGDIIEINPEYFEGNKFGSTLVCTSANVWIDDCMANFNIGDLRCNILPRKDLAEKYYQVIGNIYENPELMKGVNG